MNRVVRENYPIGELPEDLRASFSSDEVVRVIIEVDRSKAPSLEELLRLRPKQGMTREAILAQIDEVRGDFHD